MKIPEEVLDSIRARTRIQDIIGASVDLKEKGGRLWGRCPFHHEKDASFTVTPSEGRYYCFGCKKTGSLFNFVMETQGLSFIDAVEHLAELAGVEIPKQQRDAAADDMRKALYQLHEGLQKSFEALLKHEVGARARGYLESRHMPRELVEAAGIGYAPADGAWLYRYLRKKHFSPGLLAECGLFSRNNPEYSLLSDRVIFPIRDQRGRVIAFGGRALSSDARAKYINSSNTKIFSKSHQLYGLDLAQKAMYKSKRAILCEGYFDVLAFRASGIDEALAPLGTACTEDHLRLLASTVGELFLCFDGDSAGQAATMRVLQMAFAFELHVRVLKLPAGSDPWDLYEAEGASALADLIASADEGLTWALRYIESQCGSLSNARSKDAYFQKALDFIAPITSDIVREEAFRQIALSLGYSLEVVREAAQTHQRRAPQAATPSRQAGAHATRAHATGAHTLPGEAGATSARAPINLKDTMGRLMLCCCVHPKLFGYVRQHVSIDDCLRPELREIYTALELATRTEDLSLEFLLCNIENSEIHEYIFRAIEEKEFDINPDKLVRESVQSLHIRALKQHAAMLVRDIKRAEEQGSPRVRELTDEYTYVLSELQSIRRERDKNRRSD